MVRMLDIMTYTTKPTPASKQRSLDRIIKYIHRLQFASSTKKLSTSTGDGKLACLLNLRLESNCVPCLPHLGDECLPRQNDTRKANLDVLEGAKLLQDVLARNTERAQAVQDGCVETANLAELRINMQRVEVTRQTVDRSLLLGGLLLNDHVGCALRRLVRLCCGAAVATLLLATKVATSANKYRGLVVEDLLAGLSILGDRAVHDETSGALVYDLNELGDSDKLGLCRDGELADLKELLAVQKHAWVEVGNNLVEGERRLGVEGRNYTKGRDDLEVLIALVHEGKIGTLGTDPEV